jgi:hypothetical protein
MPNLEIIFKFYERLFDKCKTTLANLENSPKSLEILSISHGLYARWDAVSTSRGNS